MQIVFDIFRSGMPIRLLAMQCMHTTKCHYDLCLLQKHLIYLIELYNFLYLIELYNFLYLIDLYNFLYLIELFNFK